MEFSFKGQTALVTGSAQGLGREIALALAQHGASLVLADKVFPSDTAEVIQESGGTALALKADISLEADVQELVRQALEHHQRIDILVNNAGVSQLNFSPSEETSIQEWKTIIDIDLIGKYPTEDLHSNLYVLWGHNPDASDLPLRIAINESLKKGARLVVIDPKKIALADRAVLYLPIRPGTDGALALALIQVIIEKNLYDHDFVEKYTFGFDRLVPHIRPFNPQWAEKITWVSAGDIRKLARLFATTKGAGIYQGTCTQDQTANGTQNSRAFAVLQAITGNINVPGGEKWGLAYSYNVCHGLPYLMLRKKAIEPLDESWSEWRFYTELAKKIDLEEFFPWKSEKELVRFELGPTSLTFDQLLFEKPEGAYFGKKKYEIDETTFSTPTRKIELYSDEMARLGFDPLPVYLEPQISPLSCPELLKKYPLILSTGNRNLYYTHGQFRRIAKLHHQNPEPFAEIGPKTAERFGIQNKDTVRIETNRGSVRMKVHVEEKIAEGIVLVPHGWPGEANANLLTDTCCREPIMGYPEVKSLLCSIKTEPE